MPSKSHLDLLEIAVDLDYHIRQSKEKLQRVEHLWNVGSKSMVCQKKKTKTSSKQGDDKWMLCKKEKKKNPTIKIK